MEVLKVTNVEINNNNLKGRSIFSDWILVLVGNAFWIKKHFFLTLRKSYKIMSAISC